MEASGTVWGLVRVATHPVKRTTNAIAVPYDKVHDVMLPASDTCRFSPFDPKYLLILLLFVVANFGLVIAFPMFAIGYAVLPLSAPWKTSTA